MPPEKKTMVSILLDPKSIHTLDTFAEKARLSRSKLIHNLLEVGYEEMVAQRNLGLLKLTVLLHQFKMAVPSIFKEAEKNTEITKEPSKNSVSVRMDPELLSKIDDLAPKINLTRKSFIEYVLEFEMREIKAMLLIPGLLKAGLIYRDTIEMIKKKWKTTFKKSKEVVSKKQVTLNENSEIGSE